MKLDAVDSALPFLFLPLSQPGTRSAAVLIDELDAGTLKRAANCHATHGRSIQIGSRTYLKIPDCCRSAINEE